MATIHPRTLIVKRAQNEIGKSILDLAVKHELTYIELVHVLTEEIQSHTKFALRRERHPKDPDAPADLE